MRRLILRLGVWLCGSGMSTSNQPQPAKGVYAALLTPRRPQAIEADAAQLLEYLDQVTAAGIDGLVLFGSTGEFIHFDVSERMRVLALAIRRSRVPVFVNVSHSTLAGAIALGASAIEAGAAGLLVMPPYFYRYSDEQVAAFYQAFAGELGGKAALYLYNLPMFTTAIPPELADELLQAGRYAGIKDSTTEWQNIERLVALRRRADFSLLVGNEVLYLKGRSGGADGIVSGVAAALPELIVAMDRAIAASRPDRAQRLNTFLEEFLVYVNRFPPTAAIKQTAAARGWKVGDFAVPFGDRMRQEFTAFERWLDQWLPIVLAECTDERVMRL
ncbi:MAG: dihydrodipicolinate synthase family protein [Acidobacteriaceae bacterium]|nr:dihydrodipicolinate synthase family protein [Acidobacteriaceae bacterium]